MKDSPSHGLEEPGGGLAASLARLDQDLGAGRVLTTSDDLARFEQSVLDAHRGRAAFVVRPRTTDEVRSVVRWAVAGGHRLVVQGANTGLVRAGLPDTTATTGVLSLESCRERFELDLVNRTLTVSAGHQLDDINERLREHGLHLAIDLGTSPSVGGMVSTNTGGTRVLRHGDVRHQLLGVEVVLADQEATVLPLLSGLRKDNTGLDWMQVFVGTAGEFGIVTAATFELVPLPRQTATAWVAVDGDDDAMKLLAAFESRAHEYLTSFEAMSSEVLERRVAHDPTLRLPLSEDGIPPLSLLVELSSTRRADDGLDLEAILLEVLDRASQEGALRNAVIEAPRRLWSIRHGFDGFSRDGSAHWFDVSFPRSQVGPFRRRFRDLVTAHDGWEAMDLGHYGDGGLHAGVLYPNELGEPAADDVTRLRDEVYSLVAELGGSFSAEHGIGPYNARWYHAWTPPAVRALNRRLKSMLDPNGILGSGTLAAPGGAP